MKDYALPHFQIIGLCSPISPRDPFSSGPVAFDYITLSPPADVVYFYLCLQSIKSSGSVHLMQDLGEGGLHQKEEKYAFLTLQDFHAPGAPAFWNRVLVVQLVGETLQLHRSYFDMSQQENKHVKNQYVRLGHRRIHYFKGQNSLQSIVAELPNPSITTKSYVI